MNPIERALGIVLLLTGGRRLSAAALAERFEVSLRTIYRDVVRLASLGVPVEAGRGADGGYRLPKDFIQPPVALTRRETAALLIALGVVRGLRATPLTADLDTAERKLLAALPRASRELLVEGSRIVGVEAAANDVFHFERRPVDRRAAQHAIDLFLQGLLQGRRVRFVHTNPSRGSAKEHDAEPAAVLYDRNFWYLVGRPAGTTDTRMWRADRISMIEVTGMAYRADTDFSVQPMLGRAWLDRAMRDWVAQVETSRIRLTAARADELRGDWYYRHAAFDEEGAGHVVMTIPYTSEDGLLALLGWLGEDAELLSPQWLRQKLLEGLSRLKRRYSPRPRPAKAD